MNREEKKWFAIFKLDGPICDGCGIKLEVLEVQQKEPDFLILTVAPHGGFGKAYIAFNTKIHKTVSGGTKCNIDNISYYFTNERHNLVPMERYRR